MVLRTVLNKNTRIAISSWNQQIKWQSGDFWSDVFSFHVVWCCMVLRNCSLCARFSGEIYCKKKKKSESVWYLLLVPQTRTFLCHSKQQFSLTINSYSKKKQYNEKWNRLLYTQYVQYKPCNYEQCGSVLLLIDNKYGMNAFCNLRDQSWTLRERFKSHWHSSEVDHIFT